MKVLADHHRRMLSESGLNEEIVSERGYFTATAKTELDALGFPESQQLVPSLVVPLHTVDGLLGGYQIRPDQPRLRDGKSVKYETKSGQKPLVDVPPRCRPMLDDPDIPLWITEGSKKADCAAVHGLCCGSLQGVWNWRAGVGANGGKLELPDWDRIALNGRKVIIAFDSDVIDKPAVAKALARLSAILERRGADVYIVRIPDSDGNKVGLDDFLASGGTVDQLLAEASKDLPEAAKTDVNNRYEIVNGQVSWMRQTEAGSMPVPLCNCECYIVGYELRDDGQNVDALFIIEGSQKGIPFPAARVPVDQLSSFRWMDRYWRGRAVPSPGMLMKERLAYALRTMNRDEWDETTVYTHIGWRALEGEQVYLHAGGAIGAAGAVEGLAVEPGKAASSYLLPSPPEGTELFDAIAKSLEFLELGPDRLTVPILASAFRSVMGASDFSIYLFGRTGTRKTTLALQVMRFFSPRYGKSSMMSWNSTLNALRAGLFEVNDALAVIDDFKPGDPKMEANAAILLQSQGDLAGRDRSDIHGNQKSGKPPRALPIVTGEDLPPGGESTVARCFLIEIKKGDYRDEVGSRIEKLGVAGILAMTMSAFIRWMSGSEDRRLVGREEFAEERRFFSAVMMKRGRFHDRTPEQAAHLMIGIKRLVDFLRSCGFHTDANTKAFYERCRKAIVDAASEQGEYSASSDPAERFAELLLASIRSGSAYILNVNGTRPEGEFGWLGDHPSGRLVGWMDETEEVFYADPVAALKAVCELASGQNAPYHWSQTAVSRHLKERSLLAKVDGRSATVKKAVVKGGQPFKTRLYAISLSAVHKSRDCWDEAPSRIQEGHSEPDIPSRLPLEHEDNVGTECRDTVHLFEPGSQVIPDNPNNPDILEAHSQAETTILEVNMPTDCQRESKHSKLCTFIRKHVRTPKGPGILKQLLCDEARIALVSNPGKVDTFSLFDVDPDESADGFPTAFSGGS